MSDRSGRSVVRRALALGGLATTLANIAGVVVVFVLLAFVLPAPDVADSQAVVLRNLLGAAIYAGGAAVVGLASGWIHANRLLQWLREDRAPTSAERRRALRIPLVTTLRQLALWFVGASLFAGVNATQSVLLGVEIGVTVLIGGLTTSASTYLLLQATGREVVARATRGHHVRRPLGAGVAWRTILTWGLGSGLPVAGLTLLAGLALGLDVTGRELALAALVLGLTSLATGLLSMLLLARNITVPLGELRRALGRVEAGDLEVTVPVTDTSEVGVLQAGVTEMVEGLRERERVRDLFGLHVGHDVARRAIDEGVQLGGRSRAAAALFVDVQGSTSLAERADPEAVLGLLNDFFGVVVDVLDAHGGLVNKFMGDAALAVWGAPLEDDRPAAGALAAARELGRRLPEEVPDLRAGIGVAAGAVVAGNLGAADRLEYTVIGDPVNVAARLSSLAKDHDPAVLTDADTVAAAPRSERAEWVDAGTVVLRGRGEPTSLARPRGGERAGS